MTTNIRSHAPSAPIAAALLIAATCGLLHVQSAAANAPLHASKAAAVQDTRWLRIAPQLARLHEDYAAHTASAATHASATAKTRSARST